MSMSDWLFGSNSRYRHRTALGDSFEFDLAKQDDGTVRIYIVDAPSYGSRPTDGHSTHRYYDPHHGHFVCIREDLAPTKFSDARDWARYWAENTSSYIRWGGEFS